MQITRIYEGDDGRSHFEDLEVPLKDLGNGRGPGLEILDDVEGILLREPPAGEDLDFHNANRRMLVIHLSGEFDIDCGDGERRIFKTGEVLFGDDRRGKGHTSGSAADPRLELIIYLKQDFDTRIIGGDGSMPRTE